MNKLKHIFILLMTLTGFAQSPSTKESPTTTVLCAQTKTDNRELLTCFNKFLKNEIQTSFIVDDIIYEIPYNIRSIISFEIDSLAMIHVDKISMLGHKEDSAVINKIKRETERVCTIINKKTIKGEGLVAAKDKDGNAIAYKSNFPLNLMSEILPSSVVFLADQLESKFSEKAIYAKREGDLCFLFYQEILSKSVSVYQLDTTSKRLTLFKKYDNYDAILNDYPEIDQALKGTNYSLTYFFYKEYNYLYEIQKVNNEYRVVHYQGKSKQTNMIYENLLSIYHSNFQEFLLRK